MNILLSDIVLALDNPDIILKDNTIIFKKFTLIYENNKFISNPNDFNTQHLLHILDDVNKEEDIFLFLQQMTLTNIFNKCIVCQKNILDIGALNTCLECFEPSLTMLLDNTVTNYYNENKIAFEILLTSAFECLNDVNVNLILDDIPNAIIKKDIAIFKFDYIEKHENCDDYMLSQHINNSTYFFIKYIIKKNIICLKSHTDIINSEISLTTKINESSKTYILSVIHHNTVLEKFKNGCETLLFHGSSLSNWTSIFKKGLRNYSKSKLQKNGAAYGDGVYLAKTPQFASVYSRGKWIIIAVVKVLDDIEQYKKTDEIYVVPDDSKLLIKYIIFSKTQSITNLKDVQKLLVEESNNKISIILNTIQKKRITNELKKIKHAFVEISLGYYTIFFEKCEVSIVLSLNYPMTPPFVWFNKLNFEHEKILSNGAFFIQDLFIPNWRSSMSILNIIEMIDNIIIQSNMKYVENTYENALLEYNEKIRELNII
jgi:hypothetical protein